MDIRNFFTLTRKPSTTTQAETGSFKKEQSTNRKTLSSKDSRKRAIESDEDEDRVRVHDNDRKKKKQSDVTIRSKRKRVIISSDESNDEEQHVATDRAISKAFQISDSSDDDISVKKPGKSQVKKSPVKKNTQSKLKPTTTSKFFKDTTAKDMFGEEKVKRSADKLQNVKDKLKIFTKPVKHETEFDDQAFETALSQIDDIGVDWVDWNKTNGAKTDKKVLDNKRLENDLEPSTLNTLVVKHSQSSGYGSFESQDNWSDESHQSKPTVNDKLNTVSKPVVKLETNERLVEKFSKISSDVEHAKEKTASRLNITHGEGESHLVVDPARLLWVEKHKPQSSKKIIGQQGEKSNVRKLTDWLNNWAKNNNGSKKATFVPNGWNKDATGACFKAALLSGPPGVGKTTTVKLLCGELGFDMVELNASDTRSKKLLQEEVTELLRNTSLFPFFSKQDTNNLSVSKKHVLVMDEVDGMAGNEDRGGVQELIQLIKKTKIPIICMCNDRNHPKIRSLANYCFDLRFSRPRAEQIKGYMKGICFKEKLNISNEMLTDIIKSANNDIRIILNHLSMLAADKDTSSLEAAKKYIKLNAWDVLRKVFSVEDHKTMTIHDKCDLFFYDYSIAPLFVAENYLNIKPSCPKVQSKHQKMKLFARAANSISNGDCIDLRIRSHNAWGLLPTQAIFASVVPGDVLEGYCGAQINFPSWLGKFSKQNRMDRLLQEIAVHTRMKISASKASVNLDYAPYLQDRIISPLIKNGVEGVQSALNTLLAYDLLREDLDSLQEICQWPNTTTSFASLDSKVKSQFTRSYNKNPPMRPYSLTAPIKKSSDSTLELDTINEDMSDEDAKSDDADRMIVVKKKQQPKKVVVDSPSSSKRKQNPTTKNANKRGRKK